MKCPQAEQTSLVLSSNKEPDVLTIDAKWEQFHSTQLIDFFNLIPSTLDSNQIFSPDGDSKSNTYILKGFIAYFGHHYFSFFRLETESGPEWVRFDDRILSKKEGWEEIIEECIDCGVTPSMIFYEKVKDKKKSR